MREEEKNNPRMLPDYKPWWATGEAKHVDASWKVADLRAEAAKRNLNLNAKLKKDELIEILNENLKKYDLSDGGFRSPFFIKIEDEDGMPPCYPDIYEDAETIELLKTKSLGATQPPSA
jgi:hypothetical protein